jgi:deoxycytidylate deaminase
MDTQLPLELAAASEGIPHVSELIIACVAAVGVDLNPVEEAVTKKLSEMGYEVVSIRLARDVIPQISGVNGDGYARQFERYWKMMDAGNDVRKKFRTDILSLGVAAKIAEYRKHNNQPNKKTAFFVRSLKHPEEVVRLRAIYPRGFYLFAVQASAESRRHYLMYQKDMCKSDSNKLMDRDRKEVIKHGQRIVDTYHLADFFLCVQDEASSTEDGRMTLIQTNINRFIEILFGHPNRTPTFSEHAMFHAFSSSLRSADLSRQVGAVIARRRDILSTGANDCPSPHGGLYWPLMNPTTLQIQDVTGGRDYMNGFDSNRKELISLGKQIFRNAMSEFNEVIESGAWRQHLNNWAQLQFAVSQRDLEKELLSRLEDVLAKSPIADLTEFGRVVHAEMEALLSCARKGISTVGATLFTTTFPCHNCAKHIIAAGIRKVVFIEPYLKSKALKLHPDAIEISYPDPTQKDAEHRSKKVQFQPFVGVGPRRFFDLFSMELGSGYQMVRKDNITGEAKNWNQSNANARLEMSSESFTQREASAAEMFSNFLSVEV